MPNLTSLIRDAVVAAVDDGSIDRNDLAQLVVGPSRDRQALFVWSNDDWESYGEYDEEEPVAEISNSEWLDRVDAGEPPEGTPEPTGYQTRKSDLDLGGETYVALCNQLRVDIQKALRELATSGELGDFKKVVGLMEHGMSVSDYADLVAFVHPLGTGEIWPIHESRSGDIDIYQFGVFHDEGITMFYPEGDDDSLSGQDGMASWHTYAFADMESWHADDEDVMLRMKSDLHDISMTGGHSHDEWGGPDGEAIGAALREHFNRQPGLLFDPTRMPDPNDEAAIERWFTLYNRQNCTNAHAVVRCAYKELGENAARLFISRQPADAADRGEALEALIDRLFADRKLDQALAVIQQLEGRPRAAAWRKEMHSLLLLKRWPEAIVLAEAVASADSGERANDVLPFRAMALAGLERPTEARALLRALADEDRDADHALAEAFVFRHLDSGRAREALARALQEDDSAAELAHEYLADSPEVFALLEQRKSLEQQRKHHDARIAEIMQRVTSENRPLEVMEAAQKGMSSGPGGQAEHWRVISTLKRSDGADGDFRKVVLDAEDTTWVPTQTDGLTGFNLRHSDQPEVVETIRSETSLEDACRVGRWVFAADYSHGLTVIDLDNRSVVAHTARLFDDNLSAIAAGDGFVAGVGSCGAELYDVTVPEKPELLSVVGCSYSCPQSGDGEDVAIRNDTLFIAAGRAGLVVADVSDRRHPEIVAAITRDDREFWAKSIELIGDVAVVTCGHEAWFVDVSDPASPQSLCVLGDAEREPHIKAFAVNAARDQLVGCDENLPIVWSIDLDERSCPTTVVAHPTVDAEGNAARLFYYTDAALLPDGRLAALTRDSLVILERESAAPAVDAVDVAAPARAAEGPIRQWVLECLQDHAINHGEMPIGVMVLSLTFNSLELGLEPARSIAGIEAGPIREGGDHEPELYKTDLGDLVDLPEENGARENDPLGLREKRRAEAWIETLDAVLLSLRDETALCSHAAGRLYLARRAYDPHRDRTPVKVVDVVVDNSKPWQPHRRATAEHGPKTLAEKLDAAPSLEPFCDEARADERFRGEVLELARQGHAFALRVAWSVRDVDASAVVETLLAVAKEPSVDVFVIGALSHFMDRPEVRDLLEGIFENPPRAGYLPSAACLQIAAAEALGRATDDRIVALVRRLLEDPEGNCDHADLAMEAMEAMNARRHELLPSLRGWLDRADADDNRIPGICRQLFLAGHRELPEKLSRQSQRDKTGEQYASVNLGIKGFDDERFQDPTCASERLFTGRMLVERVAELNRRGDFESSVWPRQLPLEPWPASWEFVLDAAIPILRLYGELGGFVDRLTAHAVADEAYTADRALLLGMASYFENAEEHDAWRRIAETITTAADVFDASTVRRLLARHRRLRLQDGWTLLKAGDLTAARALAGQAVADEPNDGQVLFFDARLCWLEHENPEAGIERAKTHLDTLGHDPPGRGRLLNLIGCALDRLGSRHEALSHFERAAQADPDDPIYLANIAECHDKLGQAEPAILWAERALDHGADSEICRAIVAKKST